MKQIQCSFGVVKVDDALFELLRGVPISQSGSYPIVRLHHLVCPPGKDGAVVDHIDRDKLNATKENLRVCSRSQNTWNVPKHGGKQSSSKFIGVQKVPRLDVFRMRLACGRDSDKPSYEARFATEIEAANARDICALAEFGEFAVLNFPLETYEAIDVNDFARRYRRGRGTTFLTGKTSKYRGVSFHRACPKPYRAILFTKGKTHQIGVFATEEEAARAYDAKARKILGTKAQLNFPVIAKK